MVLLVLVSFGFLRNYSCSNFLVMSQHPWQLGDPPARAELEALRQAERTASRASIELAVEGLPFNVQSEQSQRRGSLKKGCDSKTLQSQQQVYLHISLDRCDRLLVTPTDGSS